MIRRLVEEYQDGLRAQLEYAADLNFLMPPFGRTSSMMYPRGASYDKDLLLDFFPPLDSIRSSISLISIFKIFNKITPQNQNLPLNPYNECGGLLKRILETLEK